MLEKYAGQSPKNDCKLSNKLQNIENISNYPSVVKGYFVVHGTLKLHVHVYAILT